ncbi:MAG: hypothetical protein MPJ50_14805 [Pirellulales bacterium]|nr:hypothetical protein [Pirellulales bacterium]
MTDQNTDHWATLAEQIGAEASPSKKSSQAAPANPTPKAQAPARTEPTPESLTDWGHLAAELGAPPQVPPAPQSTPPAEPERKPTSRRKPRRDKPAETNADASERSTDSATESTDDGKRPRRRSRGRGRRGDKSQRGNKKQQPATDETFVEESLTEDVKPVDAAAASDDPQVESETEKKGASRRGRRRRGRGGKSGERKTERHRERRGDDPNATGSDEIDFESISQLPESNDADEFAAGLFNKDEIHKDETEEREQPRGRRRRRRGGRKSRPTDQRNGESDQAERGAEQTDAAVADAKLDGRDADDKVEADEGSDRGKRGRKRGRRRGGRGRGSADDSSRVAVSGSADDYDLLEVDDDGNDPASEARDPEPAKRHRNITSWTEAAGVIVDRNLSQRTKNGGRGRKGRRK